MTEQLGKIISVKYGSGGYDDACHGLTVELAIGDGGSRVGDFKGNWTNYPTHAKYTLEEWKQSHLEATLWIMELMKQAKVNDVTKLAGKPVAITLEHNTLKSWRILTEVL